MTTASALAYTTSVLLRIAGMGLPFPVLKQISDLLHEETDRGRRTGFARFWREAISSCKSDYPAYHLLIWIAEEGTFFYLSISRSDSKTIGLDDIEIGREPMVMLSLTNIFRAVARA